MGTNRYDHPRGKLIKGIINNLKVARVEERWASFEDRALRVLMTAIPVLNYIWPLSGCYNKLTGKYTLD
jgi:uncharacterized protein involved in cysteine biosynthesis